MNLVEVNIVIERLYPKALKEKERSLRVFGLKVVPVEDNGLWREAALIKNKYQLSLGDAFAVATAQATHSKLVIGGDKDLKKLPIPIVKIR